MVLYARVIVNDACMKYITPAFVLAMLAFILPQVCFVVPAFLLFFFYFNEQKKVYFIKVFKPTREFP